MKIVIEMEEEKYEWVKKNNPNADPNSIVGAVVNGKPYEERPKGEWIGNSFDEYHCSLCGHYALYQEEPDDYLDDYYEVQSNFCPNCGADMRGKAHD